MFARHGWLAGGIMLAMFLCEIARAEEQLPVAGNSVGTGQIANSQPVVRRTRLFFLFGGSRYTSAPKPAPTPATNTTAAPAAASNATAAIATSLTTTPVPAPATRTTRQQDDQQPALRSNSPAAQSESRAPAASTELSASVFGSGAIPTSQLAQERRSRASGGNSDLVSGRESNIRATTDAGSLLGKSSSARGVSTQQRTPIMTDTRIRGSGVGRMVASGG